jgi:hypothetical protein
MRETSNEITNKKDGTQSRGQKDALPSAPTINRLIEGRNNKEKRRQEK